MEIPRPSGPSHRKHFWKTIIRVATLAVLGLSVYWAREPSAAERFRVLTESLHTSLADQLQATGSSPPAALSRSKTEAALRNLRTSTLSSLQEADGEFLLPSGDIVIQLRFQDDPVQRTTTLEAFVHGHPWHAVLFRLPFIPSTTHEPEFVDLVDAPPSGGQALPQPQR